MSTRELNAVFEGGGVRGIGLVGALKRLEEEGMVFPAVAGTSAGALIAALYAAGYSCAELKTLLEQTQFASLVEATPSRVKIPVRLWKRYGIHEGKQLYNWIYGLLKARNVVNFADLQGKGKRQLKIIASDLTNRSAIVFQDGEANVNVAEAVRMSAGIPFFFQAYRWGSRLVVDGGLLSNYPVWVFADSPRPTIGFKLVSNRSQAVPAAPDSLVGFVNALVGTMLEAHDKRDERRLEAPLTIHIPTGEIRATDFDLTDSQASELYKSGYVAASEFLLSSSLLNDLDEIDKVLPTSATPTSTLMNREIYESLERLRDTVTEISENGLERERLERTVEVRRPDVISTSVEVLRNLSTEPIVAVVRPVVGDAPADFERLNFKAWVQVNDGDEQKAAVTPVEGEGVKDGRTFKVEIRFRGLAAKPGDRFSVKWQFCWPGAVGRNEEYWAFGFGNGPSRAKQAKLAVFFKDGQPADHSFYAVTPTGHRPLGLPGLLIEQDGAIAYLCTTVIENPHEFYLVRWRFS